MGSGHAISGLVTHLASAAGFKSAILLFPGSPGIMRLRSEDGRIKYEMSGNFLVRSRGYWLDGETLTVTIDAPDDQWGSFAQHFRATPRYSADVAGLLDAVETKYGKLEWTFVERVGGALSSIPPTSLVDQERLRFLLGEFALLSGRINATLDPHEQMDFIAVVGEPWSVENGFLTPTFKIKRNRIEDVYGAKFEAWQKEKKPVVWQAAA